MIVSVAPTAGAVSVTTSNNASNSARSQSSSSHTEIGPPEQYTGVTGPEFMMALLIFVAASFIIALIVNVSDEIQRGKK